MTSAFRGLTSRSCYGVILAAVTRKCKNGPASDFLPPFQKEGNGLNSIESAASHFARRQPSLVSGGYSRGGFIVAKSSPLRRSDDPYEKVVRRMNTFVCEECFTEELMKHPVL